MTVYRNGQDTAHRIPWGSPTPSVKKLRWGHEGNVVVGKSTNDGNYTSDVPHQPRLIRFGSQNVESMTGMSSEVIGSVRKAEN